MDEEDEYTTVATPAATAALVTTDVPSALLLRDSSGSDQDLATEGKAAAWKIASAPVKAWYRKAPSATSPSSTSTSSAKCARFSRRPVAKLSTILGVCPSRNNRAARCDP